MRSQGLSKICQLLLRAALLAPAAALALALAWPSAAVAENQCENVQKRRTPDFDDVHGAGCEAVEDAKKECEGLKKDVDDSKKRSAAACSSVQDAAEQPGTGCGNGQKWSHSCDASYNRNMKNATDSAAGRHSGDKDSIRKKTKSCREKIDAAREAVKSARDQDLCKGKMGEVEKLDDNAKAADGYSEEVGKTEDMFRSESKEFATNEATASGRTSGDASTPGEAQPVSSQPAAGTAPVAGNSPAPAGPPGGATSPTLPMAGAGQPLSSPLEGTPAPAPASGGLPSAAPSSISAPGAPDGSGGIATVPAGNGATPQGTFAGPATASPQSQSLALGGDATAPKSGEPGSPAREALRAAEDLPQAASSDGLRRELQRALADGVARPTKPTASTGIEAAPGYSADLARAGIAPAEPHRDPATGAWVAPEAASAAPGNGGGGTAQSEALDSFGKQLSEAKIQLAGSDTDRIIKKLLGQSEAALAAAPAEPQGSEGDEIGDKNGASLFERTHEAHERSLRAGRLRGVALR